MSTSRAPSRCERSALAAEERPPEEPGPEGADEERVPVHWRQAQEMTPSPAGDLRFGVDVRTMSVKIVVVDGPWHERARLTLSGSGWTAERVRAAGEALRAHLDGHAKDGE